MSLLASFQCDIVQSAVSGAVDSTAAKAVVMLPVNCSTGFDITSTNTHDATIQLDGQNVVGHGPFLHVTVNGIPYKLQLGLV